MRTENRFSRLLSFMSGQVRQRQARFILMLFAMMAAGLLLSYPLIAARRTDARLATIEHPALATTISSPAAATITVNDPGEAVLNNDGKCTLREAINAANNNTASGVVAGECVAGMAGADTIVFSLGTGTPTINLTSALPTITQSLTIKGNTGGATRVELNGTNAGASANGLTITAGNSLIERLVINRFGGKGIEISSGGFNTVKGCIIGLDSSGTIVRANNVGILILGSSDNIIGGTAIGERNIISGQTTDGVRIEAATSPSAVAASRNKVIANYIGTDATGRFDLGNTGFGVNIEGGDLSRIGGTDTAERNVISGNNGGGLRIGVATGGNNRVIGNYIGFDASGTFPLGNGVLGGTGTAPGILIENAPNNFIGGLNDNELNFIANNLQNAGVAVVGTTATGNRILGNYITDNVGLGIDLGNNGVTVNDSLDLDAGPNNGQNTPVLSLALVGSSSTTILGSLNSLPLRSYRLEFFYNLHCDASGSGEGLAKFGAINVTTDGVGSVSFAPNFNVVLAKGQAITATATLLDGLGQPVETSEFSACLTVPGSPDTCTAALYPPTKNLRSSASSFSVEVSLAALCPWGASSTVPWATIGSGSPGLGSGTVTINVQANTGPQRVGQLSIAGKDFYITQEGPCTTAVNPVASTFSAAGGTGSLELSTGAGCAWTASTFSPWITINTAISGSGPTVLDYTVAANTGASIRAGQILIGGQIFIVSQDAPCTPTVSPQNQQVSASGGGFSASISIGAGCPWSAATADSWITLTPPAGGTGSGTLNYTVAANPGSARSGIITVAGKSLIVNQDGGCTATLSPTNQNIGQSGGINFTVDVSIGAACNWSVSTATSWITILSPANNLGNGTVTYSVTANPGTQRSGSISIAGLTFNVTQDGACSYSISPTIRQFTVEGGTATLNITAPSGCAWTATTTTPWVTLTSTASGSGNGSVTYFVSTNGSGSTRGGSITVQGQTLNISQDGGCSYNVSPTSANHPAATSTGTVNVTTTGACAWLARSNASWITITSGGSLGKTGQPLFGRLEKNGVSTTGNGAVNYTVATNTGPPRTGTIDVAGQLVTITQATGCPITISPANLTAGDVGMMYSQQLSQSGGTGSITWTISSGSLPMGMMLDSGTGLISGTPTSSGQFSFIVRATAVNGCYGEANYTLQINCQPLSITPASLNPVLVGSLLNQQLTLNGGSGALTWGVTAGALPLGVTLDSTSGLLSGTPAASGTFNFTARSTVNATNCYAERAYSLVVNCPTITVDQATINPGNLGVPYSQQFTQTGAAGGITWTISAGSLPNNLTLSTSGLLSGTPVASGTFPITVRATAGNSCFGERSYNLVIGVCSTITIMPATLPSGLINTNYDQTLTANGGSGSYSFTFTGNLPNGVTLSSAGVLSGSPTVVGTFNFTVTATDQGGCTGTKAYALTICSPITVNPATLPNGTVGSSYSQNLSAVGGGIPHSFTFSGTLPNGVTLANDGVLSGVPTVAGTFNFTVTATDTSTCTGSQSYTVTINPAGLMFYPLPRPLRILDTRAGGTACDTPGQQIPGGTSRLQTAAGRTCDSISIPASAKALTGNITTVQSGGGFLTLYPSDAAQPTVANSNFQANQVLNNVFTVGLGADGAFKIFVTSNTDVVIDVTGYYAPPGPGGLYFHPLPSPVRMLETRAGQPGCDTPGTPIAAGVERTQQGRIFCGGITIPSSAAAIVGNATAVAPGGQGFLTLYPSNAPSRPLAASSNYAFGQNMNAPFTVGLAPDGTFNIYSSQTTDLVIDVLGYYSPDATDLNGAGLLFNPLPKPVRLLETRLAQPGCYTPGALLAAGSTRTQQALGTCDGMTISATAKAIVGNATVVFPASNGFLTFWPSDAMQPGTANSNYQAGKVFNRHLTVGLGADGAFKIFTSAATDLVIDVSGYFAP